MAEVVLKDAQKEPAPSKPTAEKPLRIAVSATVSPRRALQDYAEIIWHAGRQLGVPVEIVLRPTYAESSALLARREVEAVFMCAGPFVDAREQFGAEALAVPVVRGESTYRSYVIVRKDRTWTRFEDLRGKTFAFTDPLSNTGKLYPTYRTLNLGTTPERYFSKTLYTGGHDNSIGAVASGLVDAAAVDGSIWERLKATGDAAALATRVIDRSPAFGSPPLAVHPGLDLLIKKRLKEGLLGMHLTPEGRTLLSRAGIDRFTAADLNAYESVRRMRQRVVAGK